MMTEGTCDALLEARVACDQDMDVVYRSCAAVAQSLSAWTWPYSDEVVLAFTSRACPIILDIMSKNISSVELTTMCAEFFSYVPVVPGTCDPKLAGRAGVTLFIRCIKRHTDQNVLDRICALVKTVCHNKNQDIVRETGVIDELLTLTERVKQNFLALGCIRTAIKVITDNHKVNQAYLTRTMSLKQARILYRAEVPHAVDSESLGFDENRLRDMGMTKEELIAGMNGFIQDVKTDVAAKQVHDRELEKQADACVVCGRTAGELGLARMLRCSACTLKPSYCSVQCQRACWGAHKAECKANRVHKS
jgi:hypothetical protein